MFRTIFISAVILFVGGCVSAPPFTPATIQGAECKRVCAHGQQLCVGTPWQCGTSHSNCVESCIHLDRLSK